MESRKDRILFAEDSEEYIEPYKASLEKAGFKVTYVLDGSLIAKELARRGKDYFDVILSDTEMDFVNGPEAVRGALEKGLLDDSRTLIIGMSKDSDNQKYWRELAHHSCFYDKDYFPKEAIGGKIKQCLKNFRSGGMWASKMPRITW